MPDGQVLEFTDVTKRFGNVAAVSHLSATIQPGAVTGFLGPNGAGKTTSLRMLLGLVSPTSGRARIGGRAYADLADPLRTVGAALEASSFHPGRSAANHLKVYARAAGLAPARVDEVLGLVGLADVAGRKVGGYSLGMRQRLGLATALLGDPGVLVLDEPTNGLDPEGITWMRTLLRLFAREGRTVLVSSHLLGEVQQTADRLLIMSRGNLVFQGALDELTDPSEFATVVDSPERGALVEVLRQAGWQVEVLRAGLTVRGVEPAEVGAVVAATDVPLSLLARRGPELEEVFLDLVNGVRTAVRADSGPRALEAGAPAADEVYVAAVVAGAGGALPEPDGAPDAEGPASAPDPDAPLVEDAADLAAAPVEESPDVETSATDQAPPGAWTPPAAPDTPVGTEPAADSGEPVSDDPHRPEGGER
ncbi:ABC transporter ATP-binding protein [Microbacterium sp. SORGH_AS_0888]|uniref:ABC transporter ATP-binding protein n=1 Tax=Microbacterium sp. SORGH_AS_0888 TaxID=3041791 RepID=UPI002789706C|nr:ABC transporter ATP-binding protein [Microbacterium sp. SORGH_AS_0888]MDQ1129539.1 ABC-2 type transport system ATP-binding protein [Microbacterium sp. SORGH_AS_0888]